MNVDRVALSHLEGNVGVAHLDVSLLTGRHLILGVSLVGIGQSLEGEVLHEEVLLVGGDGTVLNHVDGVTVLVGSSSLSINNSVTADGDELLLLDGVEHIDVLGNALGLEGGVGAIEDLREGGHGSRLLKREVALLLGAVQVAIERHVVAGTLVRRGDGDMATLSVNRGSVEHEVHVSLVVSTVADEVVVGLVVAEVHECLELHGLVGIALDGSGVEGAGSSGSRAVGGVGHNSGNGLCATFLNHVVGLAAHLAEPEASLVGLIAHLHGRGTRSLVSLDDDEADEHIAVVGTEVVETVVVNGELPTVATDGCGVILTGSGVQRVRLLRVGRDAGDACVLTGLVVSLLEDDDLRLGSQLQGNHVLLVLQTQPIVVGTGIVLAILGSNLLGDIAFVATGHGEVDTTLVGSCSTTLQVKEVVSAKEDARTGTCAQLIANEHIAVLQHLKVIDGCSLGHTHECHEGKSESK